MQSFFGALGITLFGMLRFGLLLIVELVLAMLIYVYLALYDLETFGYLVRQAGKVLNMLWGQVDVLFSEAVANQAYATVIGELGPKSILLLIIGLVVGAIFRFLVWLAAQPFKRREPIRV